MSRSADSPSPDHSAWRLVCDACGAEHALAPMTGGCPACARAGRIGVLEARFAPAAGPMPLSARAGRGLARFADLLPGGRELAEVSLGEGGTPLVASRHIGPALGLGRLYFKNETVNPSWSFKDRYVAVSLAVARRFGYSRTVVSSTGNLGASVAAYAARAGMDCLFLAPPGTSATLLGQARLYGAHAVVTTFDGRLELFEHLARARGWFPVGLFLRRRVQNPFGVEGYKSFAYETISALGAAPAAMLFPCARGNGLYGAWKGFLEARRWGWAAELPRMVACQPAGANSLEVSLQRGVERAVELPQIESVAFSTMETVAGDQALRAIRESGGTALSATDPEILEAVRLLGREGLCVEASSALPVACLGRLLAAGLVDPAAAIVCVLTAAGIKWPEGLGPAAPTPEVEPTPEAIDHHVQALGLGG